jgi:hypothetical protein
VAVIPIKHITITKFCAQAEGYCCPYFHCKPEEKEKLKMLNIIKVINP